MGFRETVSRQAMTFAILAATASGAVNGAQTVVTLEPSSKWVLDYGDNQCQLLRQFGGTSNRHLLRLYKTSPNQRFSMTVAGQAFAKMQGNARFALTFGGQEPDKDRWAYGAKLDGLPALVWSSVDLVAQEEEPDPREMRKTFGLPAFSGEEWVDSKGAAKLDQIKVTQGRKSVIFNTGSLGPVAAAFNHCLDTLVASWGLDPVQQRQRSKAPELKNWPSLWRDLQNYPSAASSVGEQGMVFVKVIVDENGSVAECLAEKVTVTKQLESPICGLMRRAKFAPALDSAGKPVRSFFAQKINYFMP